MRKNASLLKRVDKDTDRILNEIQAIFESRGIRMSHKEAIKWAVMFARSRILEFFRFVKGTSEDGLKRFIAKIVSGGVESDSVQEHDLVM
ncbi:MAG TPA: hypothetical protein ENG16_04745 [Archaeoglobus sp.]|nr:hypothetical protein [Archaeoglobus sp.]